ncbi:hypothetical protein HOV93_10000 [Planctomycetes bacterium FF15]|uniref:Uncharacterized protein n=1 Tax=Bremerella alba TaxID=980252 RepID=A0A7V8V2Q6_9BACT|nr:hypothetical protein [Bremerella alba]
MINLRPQCRAVLTRKRSLENYLHPAEIREVAPIELTFGDFDPVANLVAKQIYENGLHDRPWELLSRRSQNRLSMRSANCRSREVLMSNRTKKVSGSRIFRPSVDHNSDLSVVEVTR